jgi:hypothetical protein|uniref:Uncharacterized protein n=1 Tax=viral metagenome TaxID=1070528 RepID=A0A6C0DR50_9ZZZZ
MKLSQTELVVVGLLIVYIAFFSNPPPSHIRDFLSSPVGHAVFLLGIVYVTVYKSLIIGIFAGIAYVMMAVNATEYLDEKEQKPKAETKVPASSGTPDPSASLKDILGKLEKGDTVAHTATAGKSVTTPPPSTTTPKPAGDKSQSTLKPV